MGGKKDVENPVQFKSVSGTSAQSLLARGGGGGGGATEAQNITVVTYLTSASW